MTTYAIMGTDKFGYNTHGIKVDGDSMKLFCGYSLEDLMHTSGKTARGVAAELNETETEGIIWKARRSNTL
jgi:hypothetical protein